MERGKRRATGSGANAGFSIKNDPRSVALDAAIAGAPTTPTLAMLTARRLCIAARRPCLAHAGRPTANTVVTVASAGIPVKHWDKNFRPKSSPSGCVNATLVAIGGCEFALVPTLPRSFPRFRVGTKVLDASRPSRLPRRGCRAKPSRPWFARFASSKGRKASEEAFPRGSVGTSGSGGLFAVGEILAIERPNAAFRVTYTWHERAGPSLSARPPAWRRRHFRSRSRAS